MRAALLATALLATGCSDDEPAALPITGTGAPAPGIVVTRTVSEGSPADSATVVVVLEVPLDEFDAPPPIDSSGIVTALEAAGFTADAITVAGDVDFGFEIQVEVDPTRLPQVGTDIVRVIEDASAVDVSESGVVFGLGECPDLVAQLRSRAVSEARADAALLAEAADVELGPIVGVQDAGRPGYFGGPSPSSKCPAGLDGGFAIDSTSSFGGNYQPFDAAPEAMVTVVLTVTHALGGMATEAGAPAASISTTGRASVEGDADDAYVVAYVDSTSFESAQQLEDDLADDLAELGVLDGDVVVESDYDAVVQVRLDAGRVASEGAQVIEAIESLSSPAYESGVWYTAEACPDILDEARAAAYEDAEERADALASTSGVEAGQPIYVSDSSFDYLSVPPDRCDGLPVDSVRDGYPLELAGLDGAPRIEVEVWLDVSFAITG